MRIMDYASAPVLKPGTPVWVSENGSEYAATVSDYYAFARSYRLGTGELVWEGNVRAR